MALDKFKATWVSHSSIRDFLACPRYYYLRNVYKDPITGHKITRMQPPLALGQAVHDVVESLSSLPSEERFLVSPIKTFEDSWGKISGKRGGFANKEQEDEYKERGVAMLKRIIENPGPILNKAIKIKEELPNYWLSTEDEIILCGKIDWLEYLPEDDSVHIIDFKTGKVDEDETSLQLPIYHLLVANTQSRNVTRASYWYLDRDDTPREMPLPSLETAFEQVIDVSRRIKLSRKLEHLKCPLGGCRYCIPLEDIIAGKGELVGVSDYGQDIYII